MANPWSLNCCSSFHIKNFTYLPLKQLLCKITTNKIIKTILINNEQGKVVVNYSWDTWYFATAEHYLEMRFMKTLELAIYYEMNKIMFCVAAINLHQLYANSFANTKLLFFTFSIIIRSTGAKRLINVWEIYKRMALHLEECVQFWLPSFLPDLCRKNCIINEEAIKFWSFQ